MKNLIIFCILLFYSTGNFAQINSQTPWTWMKGDNIINQTGVYGSIGVENINNKPGSRNYSTTWRDNDGNMWLLGGSGYSATNSGYLNDLWKYTPATNRWTWIKGDKTINQTSVYGTLGSPHNNNKPGAIYSGISWVDTSNNIWLLGGFGNNNTGLGFLNTLWKYNPTTNQWTWIKGDKTINQVGVYGTKGIPHINNKPGARYGSQSWIDSNGNLWLFGGYGYNGTTSGILNDIWKYNPVSNEWTWVKGDNEVEKVGTYGNKGIPNQTNQPGARYVSTSWVDNNNNFWLFGGYGYDETTSGILNDIWKYNPVSNEWTWINGDKIVDQTAVYGTKGVSNESNKPGARYVSNSWKDAEGKFLLFGGYGNDASNTGYLNDLWKYDPTTDSWTWIKGDNTVNQVGIYGTQGLPAPTNKSGARNGSVSWADGTGNLWLFGGIGYDGTSSGVLNDLWKINSIQLPLPIRLIQFNGVVKNEVATLQWQAEQEINFSHYVIQRSFDGIIFQTIGTVAGSGNTDRHQYSFTDADLKNHSGSKVFYRLQLMDKDGKFTYSSILRFDWKHSFAGISAYPNPATTSINLSFQQPTDGKVTVSIINMNGQPIASNTFSTTAGKASIAMDVNKLPPGNYIINLSNQSGNVQHSFIKQ